MNTITIKIDKHSEEWVKLKSFVNTLGLPMSESEHSVRAGWIEATKRMHECGDDRLLIDDVFDNVSLSFTQLLDITRQLSHKEKIRLGSVLWDETDETEIDIPETHKRVVRNRIKEMDEHPESRLSWEEIESKIRL